MNQLAKKSVIVAVSGGGRSLDNLIAMQSAAESQYRVTGVVSSHAGCAAVIKAIHYNLPVFIGDFSQAKLAKTADALAIWSEGLKPDLCVLAGFLKLFPTESLKAPIINIHPALLPLYGGKGMYGMKVHTAVFRKKEKISGASIHFVNDRYDEGALIAQVTVNVGNCASADEIASSVFKAECDLLPRVVNEIATGRLPLAGGEIFRYEYLDK
jgi:folate-dependent phosphoribosylglycinamide formyltransferase PurN